MKESVLFRAICVAGTLHALKGVQEEPGSTAGRLGCDEFTISLAPIPAHFSRSRRVASVCPAYAAIGVFARFARQDPQ